MFKAISRKVFGTKHERDVKKLRVVIDAINDLEPEIQQLTDSQLGGKTAEFRDRLEKGETLDGILPEAFAVIREVSMRTLGLRHYDVQMMGGIVLHQGKIAEMKTGEGKTLTSTLAVYLNALSGDGVHVVTVNDYLAKRDAEWMKPVYDFLGITVGIIQNDMNHFERKAAYDADITYGTNNEFGFDYLRDNMVTDVRHKVQRVHNFAIVDEVDSILIDEARTPLIISGPTEENTDLYYKVNKIMPALSGRTKDPDPVKEKQMMENGEIDLSKYDFELDEKTKNVTLTDAGVTKVERLLHVENLYAPQNVDLVHHVNQALRAHKCFKIDVDYVVKDDEVMIVDEHTGRLLPGRRYSDGLHQAIEAKEGVKIESENQTLATITFQNFFRIYKKLSGMTGTADTEAVEFHKIYTLEVVVIPTNLPLQRQDQPDRVYRTEREKFNAIAEDIQGKYKKGQPVLVGTITIEKSEELSNLLRKLAVPHSVLNAKFHMKEAEIVAEAGKPGSVTIATNMAGRGTDIVLGGFPEYTNHLEELELEVTRDGKIEDQALQEFIRLVKQKKIDEAEKRLDAIGDDKHRSSAREVVKGGRAWLENHVKVKENGGLYILGSERHESRRIDNQLRGRAGRQGDPGESRFYLSFEDPLMRLFGSERISNIMARLGMTEGQEIEHGMVSRAIERAQKRVEGFNFDQRKHLLEYDDVMNAQRNYIYEERNSILAEGKAGEVIQEFLEMELERLVETYCPSNSSDDWDLDSLREELDYLLGFTPDIKKEDYHSGKDPQVELFQGLKEQAESYYEKKKDTLPPGQWAHIEKMVALEVIDSRWKDHLYQMDQLREGIWTVSYSEKQPLMEYKLQGFNLFRDLKERLASEIVRYIFHVEPVMEPVIEEEEEYQEVGQAMHNEVGQFGSVSQDQKVMADFGLGGQSGSGKKSKGQKSSAARKTGGGGTARKSSRRRRRR